MKKTQLIMLFILSAIMIQSCKKDAATSASTISDKILTATINGTAWIPDTVDAAITYNAAAQTKTFSVVGTTDDERVKMSVRLDNATNANNFTLATYHIDATDKVQFAYYTYQLVAPSTYDYVQVGNVEPGSGLLTVTAIDTVKKQITGTYSFTSKKVNYDSNGNYESIEISQILGGSFTNLPYAYKSN